MTAEIIRLRAVLDKTASDLSNEIARSIKAEAAIARVREMCEAAIDPNGFGARTLLDPVAVLRPLVGAE